MQLNTLAVHFLRLKRSVGHDVNFLVPVQIMAPFAFLPPTLLRLTWHVGKT